MRWLRLERRALLLLPIALIVVAVGAGSRVQEYWWARGFHEQASVKDGWAQIVDEYDDGHLTYPIRAEFKVDSVRAVDMMSGATEKATVAHGGQLWEATLSWKADPDVALVGCNVALFDRDGVQYDADGKGWESDEYRYDDPCLPEPTVGPRPEVGSTKKPQLAEGDDPRPETWDKKVYVVMKDGTVPTSVRIWYFLPRYAELPTGAGSAAG